MACPRISGSRAAKLFAQLALGALQGLLLRGRQVLAGAVEIECEHRERRAIGIGLAAPAALGRALERSGDALGILPGEHAVREIERVAVARDRTGPAAARLARARFARGAPACARFASRFPLRHGGIG